MDIKLFLVNLLTKKGIKNIKGALIVDDVVAIDRQDLRRLHTDAIIKTISQQRIEELMRKNIGKKAIKSLVDEFKATFPESDIVKQLKDDVSQEALVTFLMTNIFGIQKLYSRDVERAEAIRKWLKNASRDCYTCR